MDKRINLFKFYSDNNKNILNFSKVYENLDTMSLLIDENIQSLSFPSMNEEMEISEKEEQQLTNVFSFNITDLTPLDTFRGCIDSLAFTNTSPSPDNLPLTIVKDVSQFIDSLCLNIQNDYLKLNLEKNDTIETEDLETKKLYLTNIIERGIKRVNEVKDITKKDENIPQLQSTLFTYMMYYLQLLNEGFEDKEEGEEDVLNHMDIEIEDITYMGNEDITSEDITSSDNKKNDIKDEFEDRYTTYVLTYLLLLKICPSLLTFYTSYYIRTKLTEYKSYFRLLNDILVTALNVNETEESIEDVINKILTLIENPTSSIISESVGEKRKRDESEIQKQRQMNVDKLISEQIGLTQQPSVIEDNKRRKVTAASYFSNRNEVFHPFEPNVRNPISVFGGYQKGGSCNRIEIRNPLLYVKFLFEWTHDFGPATARAPAYVNGDYDYPEFFRSDGIFWSINRGWENIISNSKTEVEERKEKNEVDKSIFDSLSDKSTKHDEPTYVNNIIDAVVTYCSNLKDEVMYIPVMVFKFKMKQESSSSSSSFSIPEETLNFFTKCFKYFDTQRMFIKHDDTYDEIHLFITSDNTPLDELFDDKPLGFNMQDMNIENIVLALTTYRKGMYEEWDKVDKSNSVDKVVEQVFGSFKEGTRKIVDSAKTNEIKTPARLIDPITTGGFGKSINDSVGNNGYVINQEGYTPSNEFQQAIKYATIYGINQLLNAWIKNTRVVKDYELLPDSSNSNKVDSITFITSIDEPEKNFVWNVGDSTVNVICGALVNININITEKKYDYTTVVDSSIIDSITNTSNEFTKRITKTKYPDCKERWDRLYKIAKVIFLNDNFNQDRTIQNYMIVISYLKSCGDEFQRLTCEFMNYLLLKNTDTNDTYNYLLSYLPETIGEMTLNETTLNNTVDSLTSEIGNAVFFITMDRILIGESIEKNTPFVTFIQVNNNTLFEETEEKNSIFYEKGKNIKGSNISNKSSGIFTNKKSDIISPAVVDYPKLIEQNEVKIKDLITTIILKTSSVTLTKEEIDEKIINVYNQLKPIKVQTLVEGQEVSEEENIETINGQKDIMEKLSKLLLSLAYYTSNFKVVKKDMYIKCIDCEISKAVSNTIDTNMINDIQLKNNCRVPTNVKSLKTVIENMYNEPDIVDKLIDSYETANVLFLQKIGTYKKILEEFSKDKGTIALFSIDISNVIGIYKEYETYVNEHSNDFGNEIVKYAEFYLSKEKNKKRSSSMTKSYAEFNLSNETNKMEDVLEELARTFKEKEKIETVIQQKKEEEVKQKEFVSSSEENKKSGVKKMFTKLWKDAKKEFKGFFKSSKKELEVISAKIQKLTKAKQDLEVKISAKTKIYGLETFQGMISLFKERKTKETPLFSFTRRGGQERKNKNGSSNFTAVNKRVNTKKFAKTRKVMGKNKKLSGGALTTTVAKIHKKITKTKKHKKVKNGRITRRYKK
jgi:hypothetical protein